VLKIENSLLVIVDVQGKLAQLMFEKEKLIANLVRMVKGARILGIPILWNEQNPAGLGSTIPELTGLLTALQPQPKMTFSCCGNPAFMDELRRSGRRQVLLVGIEAHICVYQTAAELLQLGYEVHLVSDAVSSRTLENKQVGIERLRAQGGGDYEHGDDIVRASPHSRSVTFPRNQPIGDMTTTAETAV